MTRVYNVMSMTIMNVNIVLELFQSKGLIRLLSKSDKNELAVSFNFDCHFGSEVCEYA